MRFVFALLILTTTQAFGQPTPIKPPFDLDVCSQNSSIASVVKTPNEHKYTITVNQHATSQVYSVEGTRLKKILFSPRCDYLLVLGTHSFQVLDIKNRSLGLGTKTLGYIKLAAWTSDSKFVFAQEFKSFDQISEYSLSAAPNGNGIWKTLYQSQYPILDWVLTDGLPLQIVQEEEAGLRILEVSARQSTREKYFIPQKKCGSCGIVLGENTLTLSRMDPVKKKEFIELFNESGKLVKSDTGFSPIRFSNKKAAYLAYSGASEVIVKTMDNTTGLISQISERKKFGRHSQLRTSQQSVLVWFDSTLVSGQVIRLKDQQKPETVWKGRDFSEGISTERVDFKGPDQIIYPSYLFRPAKNFEKGVLIYLHGGGCQITQGARLELGPLDPQFIELLREGYSIFALSYHGDDYLGNNPELSAADKCGKEEMKNIFQAQRYLQKVAPNLPVFLWGHSYGAYLTNIAATYYADKASWSGFIACSGMTNIKALPEISLGTVNHTLDPIQKIEAIRAPHLICHGAKDGTVKVDQALTFIDAGRALGKPIYSHISEQDRHVFGDPQAWPHLIQAFKDFLKASVEN